MFDIDADGIRETTRRAVLRATAGALGIATVGRAGAHEWGSASTAEEVSGGSPTPQDAPGGMRRTEVAGYHSLGDVGPAGETGDASSPHYGGQTELRTRGDYAYVTFFSSDRPTPGRGMAIVDISEYNDADSKDQLDAAEMEVVSILRNNSTATACMDVKVDDTGDYVFIGTQPYTALFDTPSEDDDPEEARHKIETNEANDPAPNLGDDSGTEVPGALIAVDVSDKENPQRVDAFQVSGTGVHNLFHHRIGGDDYVFAIHDLDDGTEGVYVFRFERTTGRLLLVNQWTADGDKRQGEAGTEMSYIHDLEVHDDPRTGTPTMYLAYWDNGLYVLDASDPEDLEVLGTFEMHACHFATSLPTLVDGRRVAIASQEVPGSDESTGTVHLVDAEGIYPDADGELTDGVEYDDDGVARLSEHDVWEWQTEATGADANHAAHQNADVSFDAFELSPHNSDLSEHDGDFWLHQSHYHGGVRYLRLNTGSWQFKDSGFARPKYEDVPVESMMRGLNESQPNCWAAVESNGVTFASDINQGVHALTHDGIPLGGAPVDAEVTRDGEAATFDGTTGRVELSLESLERAETVRVRDRVPSGADVEATGGRTYEAGGARMVEFDAEAAPGDVFAYDVGGLGDGGFLGPVEVSADGGRTWEAVSGTRTVDAAGGALDARSALTTGTAAGTIGMAYRQRERLRERLSDVLDRSE